MKKRRTVLLILVGLLVVLALAVPVRAGPIVLWDQPQAASVKILHSTYRVSASAGQYGADDFSNASPWNIERIFIQGQVNVHGVLANANSLNWFIYPDVGGVPAGDPSTGGEVWSHSCSPGAWEVSISVGSKPYYRDITLDIVKAQGAPLYLPPGTYWLVFYPVVWANSYWHISASTTNLAPAQLMSPTGWGGWPTAWTAWTTYKPANSAHDLAFRLEGTFPPPPPNVKYLHSQGGLFNLTDPVGTQWHELWPFFSNEYHLSSWEDSGDSVLSYCDRIDMYQKPDGEVEWYHVEEVTITLNVTHNEPGEPMYIELEGGYNASVLMNPWGTQWHEIYPNFCTQYLLFNWIDTGPPSGKVDFCDYIFLLNKQTGEETAWHVEDVAVDIIVTIEPPPVGGEAYPVNKISLLAPWVAVAVLLAGGISWFTLRRRRTQS